MRVLKTILLIPILFFGQAFLSVGTASSELETLPPNEAGRIMVLMYHGIGPKERKWVRSISNFKKDLKTLYEKGYRPVPLRDVVNNKIDIKAGYTPVVLTFDDGREDNFRIIAQGVEPKIDPDCAVGILEQFQKDYPDFKATATFYVNGEIPFGQPEWVEYKLNYLVSSGFDVGNHTTSHDNLRLDKYSSPKAVQRAIGKQSLFLSSKISSELNYRVDTLALCHGARPGNKKLYKYLGTGKHKEHTYENIAVLNVGSGPAHSPVTSKFNPLSIPRVRAGEIDTDRLGIADWIRYFDRFGEKRYISDGDPGTVTVPRNLVDLVDNAKLQGARLVLTDPPI